MTDLFIVNMVLFLFFTSTIVFNLKPSSHHLPRLALLFAGGVILVYLMNEIKMLLLLLLLFTTQRVLHNNTSGQYGGCSKSYFKLPRPDGSTWNDVI